MSEKFTPATLDLDKYVRNFRIFYSKIVGGHPEQVNLQKKFRFLLENQVNKWRSGLFVNNADDSANSVKSFLSKARSLQPKTNQKLKQTDWLMQTSDFTRAFLFGCLVSLLQAKSKDGVQMLREHLQNDDVFIQDKVFKGANLRKIIYCWSKIQKLFQNNFNAKPHLVIAECLNDFCSQFIHRLYKVFTQGRIKSMQVRQFNQDRLKKLADIIKITITYFQLEKNEIKLVKNCGDFKKNIHIGFIVESKIYVVSKELPKKHRQEVQKQKTLIKLSKISQDLFRMYETFDIKIRNMDSVLAGRQKSIRGMGLQAPPKMGGSSKIVRKNSLSSSIKNSITLSSSRYNMSSSKY